MHRGRSGMPRLRCRVDGYGQRMGTGDVRVTVPETVRCVLLGRLRAGVCAKDVALAVLAMPYFKSGEGVGKIVDSVAPERPSLDIDERATLTNMAVEAGCVTGIVEADEWSWSTWRRGGASHGPMFGR